MSGEIERYKQRSIDLCNRLINELQKDEEEAASFFSKDLHRSYARVTDIAQEKTRRIRNKIRNI